MIGVNALNDECQGLVENQVPCDAFIFRIDVKRMNPGCIDNFIGFCAYLTVGPADTDRGEGIVSDKVVFPCEVVKDLGLAGVGQSHDSDLPVPILFDRVTHSYYHSHLWLTGSHAEGRLQLKPSA